MRLYHGDIIYSETREALTVKPDSYIAVDGGRVTGIYPEIPESLKGAEVVDCGRGVIIPAFSDLHVHASQYVQRGVGMDLLLYDWLNTYTFPQEANFRDTDYARSVYRAFTKELILHGSFHANVFTTIHREAANVLAQEMESRGLYGYIGKVNMDINSPENLCETVPGALYETERFLEENSGNRTAKPILAPRFAPTCSMELMKGLGRLGHRYSVGLHTHLVESIWEAAESVRMYPECGSDAGIYEAAGLMDNGPVIFAHFIFPTDDDIRLVKKCNAITVHCPDATANVIAGAMRAGALSDDGIRVAIGSDVGAGQGLPVYRQIASAIRLSKLKSFYEPDGNRALTLADAFYMATKAGGSVFGRVGSFEEGCLFNALVLDGLDDEFAPLTPEKRLERFCYAGDDRNIVRRYIEGNEIQI